MNQKNLLVFSVSFTVPSLFNKYRAISKNQVLRKIFLIFFQKTHFFHKSLIII